MSKLSFADKAGFISVGRLLRALSKLLLLILLVRLLTKFDYGTYRQVIMLYSLFSVVLFLGIPTSVYYFLPKLKEDEVKTFILQSEIALFYLGLLLGAIFFFTAGYWGSKFTNESLPVYLRIFALYPLFDFPTQAIPPILICFDRHRAAAIANVVFAVNNLVAVVIPLLLGYSLTVAFLCLGIVAALQFVVALGYVIKVMGGIGPFFNRFLFREQMKYSVPLGLSSIVTIISRELDKFIISLYFLPEVFAVYAVGAKELPFVTIIPYAVASTLFPKFVKLYEDKNQKDFFELWHKSIRKVSLIILPLFPFFLITAKEVVTILYTTEYVAAVPVFRIYLLLLLVHIAAFDSLVLSMGYPRIVLISTIIGLSLNVMFNILFIKLFDFIGPAIATVLVTVAITGYFLYVVKQKFAISWRAVFPWKVYGRILTISIVAGIVSLPLMIIRNSVWIKFILIVIVFWGVYGALLYYFKVIDEDDISFIKRWLSLKVLFS